MKANGFLQKGMQITDLLPVNHHVMRYGGVEKRKTRMREIKMFENGSEIGEIGALQNMTLEIMKNVSHHLDRVHQVSRCQRITRDEVQTGMLLRALV
jgi:hypothetical protein